MSLEGLMWDLLALNTQRNQIRGLVDGVNGFENKDDLSIPSINA